MRRNAQKQKKKLGSARASGTGSRKGLPKKATSGVGTRMEIVHSMVSTWKMRFAGPGKAPIDEDMVAPAMCVSDTQGNTIMNALLTCFHDFLFGMGFLNFLEAMVWCPFKLLVLVSDSASGNLKGIKRIMALLSDWVGWMVWHERCALHQVSRIQVAISKRHNFNRHLRALGNTLVRKRAYRTFVEKAKAVFERDLRFNVDAPLDGEALALHEVQVRALKRFLHKRSAAELHDRAVAGAPVATEQDAEDQALDAFLAWINAGSFSGPPARFDATKTRAEAAREGFELLDKAVLRAGSPKFEESRWLKMVPSYLWWSRFTLLTNVCRKSLDQISFSCESDSKLSDKVGVRVGRARKFFQQALVAFHLVLVVSMIHRLEAFVFVLFFSASVVVDKQGKFRPSQQSRRKDKDEDEQKAPLNDVILAAENCAGDLWQMLAAPAPDSDGEAMGVLSDLYFPAHLHSPHVKFAAMNHTTMWALSELYMRFLIRHREQPYSSCGVTAANRDEYCRRFRDTKQCCRLECQAMHEYTTTWAPGRPRTMPQRFQECHVEWQRATRASSLSEERWHTVQKVNSNFTGDPHTFSRQGASMVRMGAQQIFYNRGGRDLSSAPAPQRQAWATAARRSTSTRDRKSVSGFFEYCAEKMTLQDQ